jgi:hypothetical protein
MYRKIRKITGLVSTLLLFALACPAQLDTGTITVAVKDASGSVVPGAHIQIILSDWPIRTHRPVQASISIRTEAAIVGQFLLRCVG